MEPSKKTTLSVILPCYNEAENIPHIFKRFNEILTEDIPCEIILVNNGSTDNSMEIFNHEINKYNDFRFRIVNVEKNLGYGFGILSGLEAANGDVLAWTHADMQTDFFDVFKAYEIFLLQANQMVFVKGNRKKRAPIPQFFTFGMGLIASFALGTFLLDIGAQPKLFSRQFYLDFIKDKAPFDFSLDLFAQYQAKKYGKIVDFPVYFGKRLHGEAKGGGSIGTRIKVTKRVLQFIFELRKKVSAK